MFSFMWIIAIFCFSKCLFIAIEKDDNNFMISPLLGLYFCFFVPFANAIINKQSSFFTLILTMILSGIVVFICFHTIKFFHLFLILSDSYNKKPIPVGISSKGASLFQMKDFLNRKTNSYQVQPKEDYIILIENLKSVIKKIIIKFDTDDALTDTIKTLNKVIDFIEEKKMIPETFNKVESCYWKELEELIEKRNEIVGFMGFYSTKRKNLDKSIKEILNKIEASFSNEYARIADMIAIEAEVLSQMLALDGLTNNFDFKIKK